MDFKFQALGPIFTRIHKISMSFYEFCTAEIPVLAWQGAISIPLMAGARTTTAVEITATSLRNHNSLVKQRAFFISRHSSCFGVVTSGSYCCSLTCYKPNHKGVVVNKTATASELEKEEQDRPQQLPVLRVEEIKERCNMWRWRGHVINYLKFEALRNNEKEEESSKHPLLLVHGFGASIAHWRRNIVTMAQSHTVYAIDLLGFGGSDKPAGFAYTMEVWAQLILDFLTEVVQRPTVLIGNSVGSLACVIAAAESNHSLVRGLVLLNCAGGMNNKAVVDDWRIKLLLPVLWFVDFLLKQRKIASAILGLVKERDNLKNILLSVYGNKESVDEDLVEIIREPANDEGALDAFVSIVTGPPGPNPVQLMPKITLPVLVVWGDEDPFTPIDGPVGKYFSSLPAKQSNIGLFVLKGVGHCPHDDRPELVHEKLLPWLAQLPAS